MKKTAFSLFITVFLVVSTWQIATTLYAKELFLIPQPLHVGYKLYQVFPYFMKHALVTVQEMLGGLALATLVAFPLAWMMSRYELIRTFSQSCFILIQCLPMFVIAPVMVFSFGWSYLAILIPTALMIVFPLTISIYKGISSIPKPFTDLFYMYNASYWHTLWKLQIPYALPHIFSGMRISTAIAGIGAIAGELAGGQEGLGVCIQENRRNFDMEAVFAALILLMLLSLLFYGIIALIEIGFIQGKYYEKTDNVSSAHC